MPWAAIASAAGDVFGDVGNWLMGEQSFDYQKEMQRRAWSREDTAVQRRVADLKAAGLSPTLAAGSAAASSSPISVTTPQFGTANPAMDALSALTMQKQQANLDTQIALNQEQKRQAQRVNDVNHLSDQILANRSGQDLNGDDFSAKHPELIGVAMNQALSNVASLDSSQADAGRKQFNLNWMQKNGISDLSSGSAVDAASLKQLVSAQGLGGAAQSALLQFVWNALSSGSSTLPKALLSK